MRNGNGVSWWQRAVAVVVMSAAGVVSAAPVSDRWPSRRDNTAPQISGTPPAYAIAGQPYSFRPVATDANGDRLWFWVRNLPRWASFDSKTGELRGTPGGAQVGTFPDITIGVTDLRSYTALPKFTIQVGAGAGQVNQPPSIGGTPGAAVMAGTAYAFQPVAADPEGARLSFAIQNRPSWAGFDGSTGRLSGTPGAAHVGSYGNISISVTDGSTFSSLAPFGVEVRSAPNNAPVIAGSPATTVGAGQAYSFVPSASDADGDPLTFSVAGKPAWAGFNPANGQLSGTPGTTQVGSTGGIVISVTDGKASSALASFSIAVTAAPNRAPTIAGTPASSVVAGQPYSFTPSASDADGDSLSFSIQNRPSWATFASSSGQMSGTPTDTQVGGYGNILISVSDGKTSTALPPFGVTVSAAPNRAPVIGGQPATTVVAGQTYSFTPNASDPDGDMLSFAVTAKPAWASFDASTGRLSGTPSAAQVGSSPGIRISVTDGKTFSELAPFSITVTQAPNEAPTITGAPAASVVAGQPYAFTPIASDADGDPLSFSIQSRPTWATFASSTGQLSGTPTSAHVGSYPNIVISVSDGKTSTALPPFGVTVSAAPNRAPTITGSPATSVIAGQPYAFTPAATDADGDALIFNIQNRPVWATFSSSNGRLSGTPTSAQVGSYASVVISVSDGKTSTALPSFGITVTAAPNRAPTITGQPAPTVTADQPYSFTPAASDPDGDVLTFSIQNRPAWAAFSPTTGRLSGTPSGAQAGLHTNIVISVSDGKASASLAAFTINVEQGATQSVTLSWQAPTQNEDGSPLTDLTGYQVHYGQTSGQYTQTVSLPNAGLTSVTIEDLTPATWYFAVKAVNSSGVQSSFSNEAWKTIN